MARLTAVVLLLILAVALAFVPPTPHTSKTWHDWMMDGDLALTRALCRVQSNGMIDRRSVDR